MQLSVAKEIFGSPWHLDAQGLQQYFPVVLGMMNGAVVADEDEPTENIPFALSAETGQPVMWHDEDDDSAGEEEPKRQKVIHVLPVRGVMMKQDMPCGPRGTRTLANRLLQADADPSVIGHLLIFEGPGGAANAVPELADALQQCKKKHLGWVDGMAASAHQYVLSYCNEKWASRDTDILGSIGTMLIYSGRVQKSEEDLFKVREVTIYADDAFEKNEEYEKAINNFDFKLAKERILNPFNKQFQDDIKANCPGVEDKHLHGRVFQAKEVVGALIDNIGKFDQAVNRLIEMSNYKNEEETAQGQNKGQAASNNQKQVKMKQFKNVNAALEVESLEAVDGTVSLNEEQLEALDTALGQDPSEEVQSQLDAANNTIGERDTTITDLEGQVETANQTIAERDTAITDLKEKVKNLETEVAELKGDAADDGKGILRKNDATKKAEAGAISAKYENPFDALDEVAKEFTGKSINE